MPQVELTLPVEPSPSKQDSGLPQELFGSQVAVLLVAPISGSQLAPKAGAVSPHLLSQAVDEAK